jgi:hypothetical protein
MGQLDDAIREHLELKRRGGTDPTEVAQMEHDALGPVVRGEPLPEPVDGGHGVDAAEPGGGVESAEAAPLHADELHEPVDEVQEPPVDDTHEPHPAAESEPVDEPEAGATQEYDVEAAQAEDHGDAPEPARPAPAQAPSDPVDEKAEAGAKPDELLKQTPEFLQETPEHDRLWFEQGPPQEFDFDK